MKGDTSVWRSNGKMLFLPGIKQRPKMSKLFDEMVCAKYTKQLNYIALAISASLQLKKEKYKTLGNVDECSKKLFNQTNW